MIKPIAIIGGGITGLFTATLLHKNHIPYILFEKESKIGGRVQTDSKDNFLMDRGFQVLQSTYPDIQGNLDFSKLDLKYFPSGAKCLHKGEFIEFANPFANVFKFLESVFSGFLKFQDLWAFFILALKLTAFSFNYERMSNISTMEYLKKLGFSQTLINSFFIPFFGGVFLDKSLSQPKELFLFFMQEFLKGKISIPAKGMGEIANQLYEELDSDAVKLNSFVKKVESDKVWVGEEIYEVSEVIMATDLKVTAKLLEIELAEDSFGGCVNYYFSIEKGKFDSGILYLINEKILHFSVISQVSPEYANENNDLLSITTLGMEFTDSEIREEFESFFPEIHLEKKIGKYVLPNALPKINSQIELKKAADEKGIILAGDYLLYPSLNACFQSGKYAFETIVKFRNFAQL